MIGVGLVGPVPEQISKERVLCSNVDGWIVGLLGLHGLGRRGSHQEQGRIVVRALDKNESVSLASLSVNIRLFVASRIIKTILIREDEC